MSKNSYKRRHHNGKSNKDGPDNKQLKPEKKSDGLSNDTIQDEAHNANTDVVDGQKTFWAFGTMGVLLTCEIGNETRSFRDAVSILSFYLKDLTGESGMNADDVAATENNTTTTSAKTAALGTPAKTEPPLSLEEELAIIRCGGTIEEDGSTFLPLSKKGTRRGGRRKREGDGPFRMLDLGVRGCVYLCYNREAVTKSGLDVSCTSEEAFVSDQKRGEFDPVALVHTTLADAAALVSSSHASGKAGGMMNETVLRRANRAPSSRFISRIVPVQRTCYANLKEIEICAKALVEEHMIVNGMGGNNGSKTASRMPNKCKETFSVVFRRRNCSHLSRMDVINLVAKCINNTDFEVNLSKSDGVRNADYLIMVDVCKTFVMMSVVRRDDRVVTMLLPPENDRDVAAVEGGADNNGESASGFPKVHKMDNFNLSELVRHISSNYN